MATIKTGSGRRKVPKKSAPKQKIKIIFRDRECDKEHGEIKLQEKSVTENGTVTPDSGFDGLSKVNVNVSGGEEKPIVHKLLCYTFGDAYFYFDENYITREYVTASAKPITDNNIYKASLIKNDFPEEHLKRAEQYDYQYTEEVVKNPTEIKFSIENSHCGYYKVQTYQYDVSHCYVRFNGAFLKLNEYKEDTVYFYNFNNQHIYVGGPEHYIKTNIVLKLAD